MSSLFLPFTCIKQKKAAIELIATSRQKTTAGESSLRQYHFFAWQFPIPEHAG
jgi:hypothetical protein